MKKLYIILFVVLLSFTMHSQRYELGIVNVSDNNFKVVAIPNFTSSENTNVSDVGFTLTLPAGTGDVVNLTSILGTTWTVTPLKASALFGAGIGDNMRDFYVIKRDPGSTMVDHLSGQKVDLVSFDIDTMPTSGTMTFLDNSDPIAMTAVFGGGLNSFYNSEYHKTGVDDYFSGYVTGLESFAFSTLGLEDEVLTNGDISIYPNPASNFINITSSSLKIEAVEMFDLFGKLVLTAEHVNQVKVDRLPIGMYMLKVYSDKGKFIKKIIIE